MQLLRVEEPENAALGGVWIGAHPSIGEKIAHALVNSGSLTELPAVTAVQREVTGVAGTDMRCDFLLSHAEEKGTPKRTVLEVKTVVDTDYDPKNHPPSSSEKGKKDQPTFLGRTTPYERAGIFPWGRGAQKGPEGEKVVSARAIKHTRELTAIAAGERLEEGVALRSALLFVVTRHDAGFFRPNDEACPSFARYLREAEAAGVQVLARSVRWGEGDDVGKAFDEGALPVRFE